MPFLRFKYRSNASTRVPIVSASMRARGLRVIGIAAPKRIKTGPLACAGPSGKRHQYECQTEELQIAPLPILSNIACESFDSVWYIRGADAMRPRKIATIFGTKVSVIS